MKMIWRGRIVAIVGRYATAYEWQIGPLHGRWCFLRGKHWRWRPWRRVSFGYDRNWWRDQA